VKKQTLAGSCRQLLNTTKRCAVARDFEQAERLLAATMELIVTADWPVVGTFRPQDNTVAAWHRVRAFVDAAKLAPPEEPKKKGLLHVAVYERRKMELGL